MQNIALLGLGVMGSGMAANWLDKGFAVTVWNRTRAKADPLVAKGARIAATPREAAKDADIIVAMVTDDAASRSVWLGNDGALAGAKAGAVAIEMSTLTPGWLHELAAAARQRGLETSRFSRRREQGGRRGGPARAFCRGRSGDARARQAGA